MKKKYVKERLKRYGHTLIAPSWYKGKKVEKSVLFRTFDKQGICFQFYVDWGKEYASLQMLSDIMVHDAIDASYMFF